MCILFCFRVVVDIYVYRIVNRFRWIKKTIKFLEEIRIVLEEWLFRWGMVGFG